MYPTARNLVMLALKAANQEAGIGYNQTIRIWNENGIRIDIWRKDWDYGVKLRCEDIVSLPILRCHANRWKPEPDCMKLADRWLQLVIERRSERLNQQLTIY